MKPSQAEMTMSSERPHAAGSGECLCCLVVSDGAVGFEVIRMACQIAEKTSCVGYEAWLVLAAIDRTICQAPRLVESIEKQARAGHRVIAPATMNEDSFGLLTLKVLLTFAQTAERPTGIAKLRVDPGQ